MILHDRDHPVTYGATPPRRGTLGEDALLPVPLLGGVAPQVTGWSIQALLSTLNN
jgi:hypothetical protein